MKTTPMMLAATLALGLGACAGGYGGVGYAGGYNPEYERYYGDVGGYRSVPYGYAGRNFGWSSGYYYPGTGNYVYDRRGQQRQWSSREQRYWQNRAQREDHRGDHHGDRDDRRH